MQTRTCERTSRGGRVRAQRTKRFVCCEPTVVRGTPAGSGLRSRGAEQPAEEITFPTTQQQLVTSGSSERRTETNGWRRRGNLRPHRNPGEAWTLTGLQLGPAGSERPSHRAVLDQSQPGEGSLRTLRETQGQARHLVAVERTAHSLV